MLPPPSALILKDLSLADCSLPQDRSPSTPSPVKNLGALLEAAGSSYEKTVKTTCFLADMDDFAAFNQVYGQYFTGKPARSCVAVKTLPKNVLCEVEVIAEV